MLVKDLSGQRFGKWTVIDRTSKTDAKGRIYWIARCECGTIAVIRGDNLRLGRSLACTWCSNRGSGRKSNVITQGA